MTQLVLVLLAIAWVVVLAPDVARRFRPRRRATSSLDQFRQQLDSLGRSVPAAADLSQRQRPKDSGESQPGPARRRVGPSTTMPTTPQQAAVRRRDIGSLLALCMLVTMAGTLATGSLWALAAFVCMGGLTASYAGLVVRRRRAAPTAEVHYLPLRDQSSSSTVKMVRRMANE
ncbi:hypothetical protein [Candidatus Poriferisodalis sp.]|uniref:hypothetical protein n=1 Tax=Candidatus Poriferisodalis sp. TaxID=3101277 RepID=UPI003B02E43F